MAEPSLGDSATAGDRDDQKCSIGLGVRGPPSIGDDKKRGVWSALEGAVRLPAVMPNTGCLLVGEGIGICVVMDTAFKAGEGGTRWVGGGIGESAAGVRMMGQGLGLEEEEEEIIVVGRGGGGTKDVEDEGGVMRARGDGGR